MADSKEKVIDKASSLVDAIGATAIDIFDASKKVVIDAIDQYGSQAIEAVLWVVRIDAIQTLVVALFWFILFIFIFKKSFDKFRQAIKQNDTPEVWFISMVVCVFFWFIKAAPLINVWNYVAVVKPEIYLVKQVVDIVKNKAEFGNK